MASLFSRESRESREFRESKDLAKAPLKFSVFTASCLPCSDPQSLDTH